MSKLSDKEKKLLFLLFVVVVSVVCIRIVLIPIVISYETLQNQVQEGKDKLADLNLKLAQGEQIAGQIEEIIEKVDEASEAFFPVAPEEIIQKWMIREAKKANLNLSSLTISAPIIETVTPYTVATADTSAVSYPIGQLYEEMMAIMKPITEDGEGASVEQPTQEQTGEVTDQVMKTTITMTFQATEADFIRFLNNMKALEKHIIIENVPMDSFKESGVQTTVTLSMYSIHKQRDEIFKN